MKNIKSYQAELLLLSVTIAWGVTFLIVQDAVKNVPVYSFLFFRFFIASILMFLISYKRFKNIKKKDILNGVVLGILLFSGFATQTFGLQYTSSSIVAFLTGFIVIFVPFLSYFIFKIKIKNKIIISSFISLIGLYLLTMSGELNFAKGEYLSLICASLFAMHLIYTSRLSKKDDIFLIVLFQFLSVSILSLIASLTLEQYTFNIQYDYIFLKAVIITSFFATFYAFLIQTYMQQYISPSKTAIIFTFEPISASLYGYYVGAEIFTLEQIIGAIFIIVSILLVEIKFKFSKKLS